MASAEAQLVSALINSFNLNDEEIHSMVESTLQENTSHWIQPQRVIDAMNGIIEKFEIQGQCGKYKSLQACFQHYQATHAAMHKDNATHILHLLLELSNEPLHHRACQPSRNIAAIIEYADRKRIATEDSNTAEQSSFCEAVQIMASKQLAEWQYECDACEDELSEWSQQSHKDTDTDRADDDDAHDDDDEVLKDMDMNSTPFGNASDNVDTQTTLTSLLSVPEVTEFAALISALMGVDSIYFKWRKDGYVCLGSSDLLTECCSLLPYANYYKHCSQVVEFVARHSKEMSLCVGACFATLSEFLQLYRENLNWFLCCDYFATQSVLELAYFMSQSFMTLECIHESVVKCVDDALFQRTLHTHALVDHLYQLLTDILCDEYSVKSSTIMSLFLSTIAPYFDMFDEWLFHGRLRDPFHEFFVETKRTAALHDDNKDSNHNKMDEYVLRADKIPCFLKEDAIADAILMNGKSLLILADLQRQTNQAYKLSEKPFSSTFAYFQDLLSKYYPLEYGIQVAQQQHSANTQSSSPEKMLILTPKKQRNQLKFASPKHTKRHKQKDSAPPATRKLSAVQLMTWINGTEQTFIDAPSIVSAAQNASASAAYNLRDDDEFVGVAPALNMKALPTDDTKYIHAEMVHIPFQQLIAGQLLPKIATYCRNVNQLLLDSIDFIPHLIRLRVFYFMQASDILHSFLPSLLNIMCSPLWGKQIRTTEALQCAMQDSVYRSQLPSEKITVEWKFVTRKQQPQNTNASVITNESKMNMDDDDDSKHERESEPTAPIVSVINQIKKLFFRLHVEWPLNIVITPSIIHSYNRIFRFLLQIKTCLYMLETVDIELRAKYKRTPHLLGDDVVHRFLAFRQKLYLFVNSLNNYCCLQIGGTQWKRMVHCIMNECIGLEEICRQHQAFVDKILQNLFLPKHEHEHSVIASHVLHLLLCCDDIQKCWNAEISEYLQFKQEIFAVKQTSLFQHEKNKLWRLKENAVKSIEMLDIKFVRLYKFCLVTIDRIKNKTLSQNAMTVGLHLDFNDFYAHYFQMI